VKILGQIQHVPPKCRELYSKIAFRSIQKNVAAERFFSRRVVKDDDPGATQSE